MTEMITGEVVDIIQSRKGKMPAGWRIVTYENTGAGKLDLLIPMKHFKTFTVTDQIRIAEVTNDICEQIVRTGLPCHIIKVVE